jgi:tetratricopeptide (TPR) repeat protein
MARALEKSPFVFLALGFWILVCSASLAEDDDPNALNQQVNQFIEQEKYQEAIPIAERAVKVAKRTRGQGEPETVEALLNLAAIFYDIGEYAQAVPLYQELREISQRLLGQESAGTAHILLRVPAVAGSSGPSLAAQDSGG